MGLFKKLFTADPDALQKKADALFEAGEFGSAKLAYEKAADAADDEDRAAIEDRVRECADGIASGRIEHARRYIADGELELAAYELEGAREVAVTNTIRETAQQLLDGLEADDAREQAVTLEMTDEERIALIAGQWQEAQADEYEAYGQPLFDALIAMQTERLEDAITGLEQILQTAESPRYLWLELGRVRLLAEDHDGAKEALHRFLDALGEEEGGETRLAARLALARLAEDSGELEVATAHFEHGVTAMPDDYRPYLALGAFLRRSGHPTEAIEVLKNSLELSKNAGPDWRLFEETGLAYQATGENDKGRKFLEQVVEFFTQRQETDFPPATALALSRRSTRATATSSGPPTCIERSAKEAIATTTDATTTKPAGCSRCWGCTTRPHRMLTRAQALSEGDEELETKIAAILQD